MVEKNESINFSPDENEEPRKKKSTHKRRFADYNDNDDGHIDEKNAVNE